MWRSNSSDLEARRPATADPLRSQEQAKDPLGKVEGLLKNCIEALDSVRGQCAALRKENLELQRHLFAASRPHSKSSTSKRHAASGDLTVSDYALQPVIPGRLTDEEPIEDDGLGQAERSLSERSPRPSDVNPEAWGDDAFTLHKAWATKSKSSITMIKSKTFGGVRAPTQPAHRQGSIVSGGVSIENALAEEYSNDMTIEEWHPWFTWVLHPESASRSVWEVMGVLLVSYDVVQLPMQLLNPPSNAFLDFMSWCARLFWTCDIVLPFLSGYIERSGKIQMNPVKIARRYLLSWFAPDFTIVVLDWVDLILVAAESGADLDSDVFKLGRSSRVLKILRLLRLLRIIRINSVSVIFERYQWQHQATTALKLIGEISKTMLSVLLLAHVIGCIWYGIADTSKDSNIGYWFETLSEIESNFMGRYLISYHWALTQFHGGMDEFRPANYYERAYAIFILVISTFISAGIISRLTTLTSELQMHSKGEAEQFSSLRQFLRQRDINTSLTLRIIRSARDNSRLHKSTMREHDVELLSMISKGLRVELDFQMFRPIFATHIFFERYIEEFPMVMRKISNEASKLTWVFEGDIMFSEGEQPARPRMFIPQEGTLSYIDCFGRVYKIEACSTDDRPIISEPNLWTYWVHCGMLKALTKVSMFELDATKFQEIALQFDHGHFDPRRYAVAYVEMLKNRDMVSDMVMPFSDEESDQLLATLSYSRAFS
eukprot:TRINITY_DN25338_c0_g1_i1.p1 TRINITY_DN25338_c0_g1~~TRINITY_DN25338_c0_g1_i1.p1  ORF type:complete len:717 (-),score=105.12 TRINITY_DN25338_c0_g1_i1:314-2464(-)